MIKPLQAIANNVASNPYATSSRSAQEGYKNSLNFGARGEKLNINCNEVRSLTRDGLKLDLYA